MGARGFAAAFVVTVTVSCTPASPAQTPGGSSTHLERQANGTCLLSEEIDCPPETACNPPPPQRVDCDTRAPIADEARPGPADQPPASE